MFTKHTNCLFCPVSLSHQYSHLLRPLAAAHPPPLFVLIWGENAQPNYRRRGCGVRQEALSGAYRGETGRGTGWDACKLSLPATKKNDGESPELGSDTVEWRNQ